MQWRKGFSIFPLALVTKLVPIYRETQDPSAKRNAQPAELLIRDSMNIRDFFPFMKFSRLIASALVEYISW